MANRLLPPRLTRRRIWLACAVAIATDAIQLFLLVLGPFGMLGVDEVLDVIAMVLQSALIGFHPLFLPTFVAEFIPVVDMLPSWTACTLIVIGLRRKQGAPPPPVQSAGKVIDVGAEVKRL